MFKPEAIATRATACLILSGILSSVSYAGTPAKVELTGDVHTTARTGYAGRLSRSAPRTARTMRCGDCTRRKRMRSPTFHAGYK